MAGCLDTLQHNASFDWDTRRNTYSAIFAGFLFFFAWWLVIDTAVVFTPKGNWNNWVNSVSNRALEGLYSEEGVLGVKGTRIWLMIGFIGSFACIIAGIWIMFGDYVLQKNDNPKWPGVAIFLHTLLTFIASLTYKFGRSEELWD
uniref:Transmembrane protein 50A n=1 Tax=Meloidogyne hapla TaxID=6305 RepID=A0A1I8C0Q8_MELHA